MNKSFPGMNGKTAGFEDPLGILTACHERILRYSDLLLKLNSYIEEKGVDHEAHNTAKQIHHYFTTAGKLHHQDEEQDLFPLLIAAHAQTADLVSELAVEHTSLDQLWLEIETVLVERLVSGTSAEFQRVCQRFDALNKAHIDKENSYIFPIAQQYLDDGEIARFGQRMAQRRGLTT